MLELMHLDRLESRSSRAESGRMSYGWPAYFSAVYLPAGGAPALLGDSVLGGLPGRLLQVFLDLPSAALLTRLRAVRDHLVAATRVEESDAARLRALLAGQHEQAVRELAAARAALAALDQEPDTSVTALAETVSRLTAATVAAESHLRETRQTYETLRWQRQRDEKYLNDLREDAVARILFHALDPSVCPRCETPISAERRRAEQLRRQCAVCTEPIGAGATDPAFAASIEQEARWRLTGSRNAELLAGTQVEDAERYVRQARTALAQAEQQLTEAGGGRRPSLRAEAVGRVARWEGAATALGSTAVADTDGRSALPRVLDATIALLAEEQAEASERLFGALNDHIAELARGFGFRDLDSVVIDRVGRLQVFKTGGPREWFTNQSPGERLRLRIAVVVALRRVGHAYGMATHPGFLMLDSPRAEEVQDEDAAALLRALERLCAETSGLQILVTTADERLVRQVLTGSTVVAPPGRGLPLW
jgi:hypothetical protein